MPVIDLGKVVGDPGASMRFRGEWNSGSEYFNNTTYVDTVTHHGSLWVCKKTNTGQEPIEGDYWGIGAQGNSDLNASDVTYDNESSGLSSNTAQGAIDEIVEIEKVINGNQADLYSPDETYTAGRLVINNNALWKAKQDINVAEAWTPDHWDPTTLAAELSAVNSRIVGISKVVGVTSTGERQNTGATVDIPAGAFFCFTAVAMFSNSSALWVGIADRDNVNACQANANSGFNNASCTISGINNTDDNISYHIFAQWSGKAENEIRLSGFYIRKS